MRSKPLKCMQIEQGGMIMELFQYKKQDGSFDYDYYKKVQIEGNKRKIDRVWAQKENIEFLARYISQEIGQPQFGLCHGTRQGKEQLWFSEYLHCQVLGTEISDAATQFPNTIQWDFHQVKPEWLGNVDFIYSNSLDHSYDPCACLKAWISCLKPNGICIIEHTSNHQKATELDPFGADISEMPFLIDQWGAGQFYVKEVIEMPTLPPEAKRGYFFIIKQANPLLKDRRRIFIDLGAYNGCSVRKFTHYCERFEVYSFEPNPIFQQRLQQLPCIYIPKAAWIFNGQIDFYLDQVDYDGSSLFENKINLADKKKIKVDCIDFSGWLKSTFRSEDFIILKMDIEGAEYAVIEKMAQDGVLSYVKELFVEFHGHKIGLTKLQQAHIEKLLADHCLSYHRWDSLLWDSSQPEPAEIKILRKKYPEIIKTQYRLNLDSVFMPKQEKANNASDLLTIVVRSVGERTEQACLKVLQKQIPNANIHVVHQSPFWKALEETYQIGLKENRQWTLALDADVVLEAEAIEKLLSDAQNSAPTTFCVIGLLFDVLLNTARPVGFHLYRTQFLEDALKHLQSVNLTIRPESGVVQKMKKQGFGYVQSNEIYGVHDAEQYYRDIYRKCFVHAQKNPDLVKSAKAYWIAHSEDNPDFRVALRAVEDAQRYTKQVQIDAKADFLRNVDQILAQMGLKEKPPLSEEQIEMLYRSLSTMSPVFSRALCQDGASRWIENARQAMSERRWSDAMAYWQKVVERLQDKTPQEIYDALNECWHHQGSFPKASFLQEQMRGQVDKYEFLRRLHQAVSPSLYLEIGVQRGTSLALASCRAIGVDPACQIERPTKTSDLLIKKSSDEFFATEAQTVLSQAPDLVFIDGMHWFEFVLRDFINVERFSAPWTVVAIDDIFPAHPDQARRERITRTWTGDVWKLYYCLKQYRPDLTLLPLDVSPTGMLLIMGLDKHNTLLKEKYGELLNQFNRSDDVPAEILCRSEALKPTDQLIQQVAQKVQLLQQRAKPDISVINGVASEPKSTTVYLSHEGKAWKLAVYTAIAGDYDDLIEPIYLNPDCDYICFTDNPRLQSTRWEIRPLPFVQISPRLKAKMPKLLPHLFLSDYQASVWVDANIQIRGDIKQLADSVLKEKPMAVFSHPENRPSVYEEAMECIRRGKDDPQVIVKQMEWYAAQGLPAKPIPACGILFRRHFDPAVVVAMEQWWLQVNQFSSRDQLSFAYVVEKCRLPLFVISENLRDNIYFKWMPHKQTDRKRAADKLLAMPEVAYKKVAYKPWGHPVRVWSNQQLRLIAPWVEGAVLNVSGWEDKDKEGGFYRDYFTNASRYDISNFSHNHPKTGADRMFFLDLTKPLAAELIEQYDAVFCHTTLEHIFDIFTAFRNLCLLTKDLLILVVPFIQQQHEKPAYKDYWRFTPSCLRQLLQENKLTSVYEAYSDQPHQVNYLFFVGSKQPQRWAGKMPSYQPLDAVGSWIK